MEKMVWKHVVLEDGVPVASYDDKSIANRFLEAGSPGTTIRVQMSLAQNVPDDTPDNPWVAQLSQGLSVWRVRYSLRDKEVKGVKRLGAMSMPEDEDDRIEFSESDTEAYVYLWANSGSSAADKAALTISTIPMKQAELELDAEVMEPPMKALTEAEREALDKEKDRSWHRRLWPFNTWGSS